VAREELIPEVVRRQAYALCVETDVTDTPQVALTLQLNGLLWTGDRALVRGLQAAGFDQFYRP
jgi:predicted nucleic acid-binding protein